MAVLNQVIFFSEGPIPNIDNLISQGILEEFEAKKNHLPHRIGIEEIEDPKQRTRAQRKVERVKTQLAEWLEELNDEDTFSPSYGIVSRALITGGLNKVLGRTVDIEYRLELF